MSAWRVEFNDEAARILRKLDRPVARRIVVALERLADAQEPASLCKALTGPLAGRWRYRVGDWRVICDLQRQRLVIVAITIGHRGDVYD